MDAAQIVDLVDPTEAFAGRSRILGVVVGASHMNALRGADCGTQFAADALFHAVFVSVQHVATMKALRLVDFLVHRLGVALLALEQPSA